MISKIIQSSAINTKVLSMKRGGLFINDYNTLSRLSSVSEVAAFLKNNTRYASVLKDTDVSSVHRGALENILKGQLRQDLKSLLSFSPLPAKFFLNIFAVEEEIYNIKILLRYLFAESIEAYQRKNIFTSQNFSKLKNINSFNEFVEALANTPYYGALKPFINFPEKQNLFEIETALDMCFKRLCRKLIKKCSDKENAKTLLRSFGIRFDLETVMFIIRSKKYYDFSPEQIYPYLSSNPYRLKSSDIKSMVTAKNTDEIIDILKNTPYKSVFFKDLNFFENNVNKYILRVHRDLYRKKTHSIEAVLYYITLKEIEIKNITTLIEGIRYGLSPEEISKHLIILKNTDSGGQAVI